MHEKRNFVLVIALIASVIWAVIALFLLDADAILRLPQRIASLTAFVGCAAWLVYALKVEDKLPNHLKEAIGGMYYEADGICFMPIVRANGDQAELSLYYQNRYENTAEAIVHLRPPEDSFVIRPGMRDIHIAFRADGGDFGVIHQPIAVPSHLQGEVVNVELAAGSYYPRSHGARWRREPGMPCGSLLVDWGGAAFKTGIHEVSGEIDLIKPATLHLSMPAGVCEDAQDQNVWRQEQLVAGSSQ